MSDAQRSLLIPEHSINFVKSKYKYIQSYRNTSTLDKTRKNIFQIKSRLSGIKDSDMLLYLSINLFKLITHIYSKYEIGSAGVSVTFKDKNINTKIIDMSDKEGLNSILTDIVNKKSSVGYSVIRVKTDKDKNPVIQKIPTPNYYVDTSGLDVGSKWSDIKKHYIVNIEKVEENNTTVSYAHVDSYEYDEINNNWIGKYEKYKYKSGFNFKKEDWIELKGEEVLPYLNIFVFQNEILFDEEDTEFGVEEKKDQKGNNNIFFAESDYNDIFDLIQDINDRFSQISVELIQNLRSKMSVPESHINQLSRVDLMNKKNNKNIGDTEDTSNRTVVVDSEGVKNSTNINGFDWIMHKQGEQPAHFITKDNPMIDKAIDVIDKHMRIIASLCEIPLSLLGIQEASGNKKVGVDDNEFDSFYTKIEQRRIRIYPMLQKLYAYIGYILSSGKTYELPTIKFQKLKSKNTKDKVDYLSTMMADGVLSKESYIKIALDYDDEEMKEEMKKISSQDIQKQHIAGKMIPSLDNNNEE